MSYHYLMLMLIQSSPACWSCHFYQWNLKTSRTVNFLKLTLNHQLPMNLSDVSVVGEGKNFYSSPMCENSERLECHARMSGLNYGYSQMLFLNFYFAMEIQAHVALDCLKEFYWRLNIHHSDSLKQTQSWCNATHLINYSDKIKHILKFSHILISIIFEDYSIFSLNKIQNSGCTFHN